MVGNKNRLLAPPTRKTGIIYFLDMPYGKIIGVLGLGFF